MTLANEWRAVIWEQSTKEETGLRVIDPMLDITSAELGVEEAKRLAGLLKLNGHPRDPQTWPVNPLG